MNEKRSPEGESAQLPLPLGRPGEGVGARQGDPGPQDGGGGYQDVCTVLEFQKNSPTSKKSAPRDPRLEEFRRMGLGRVWLQVAEEIGADAFLAVWRILDADPSSWHNETILRVMLRPYRSYLRYQRNRFIEVMVAQGLKPHEIKRRLVRQLGENVSHRHIERLAAMVRIP